MLVKAIVNYMKIHFKKKRQWRDKTKQRWNLDAAAFDTAKGNAV
jgi:hypothetical protein